MVLCVCVLVVYSMIVLVRVIKMAKCVHGPLLVLLDSDSVGAIDYLQIVNIFLVNFRSSAFYQHQ